MLPTWKAILIFWEFPKGTLRGTRMGKAKSLILGKLLIELKFSDKRILSFGLPEPIKSSEMRTTSFSTVFQTIL